MLRGCEVHARHTIMPPDSLTACHRDPVHGSSFGNCTARLWEIGDNCGRVGSMGTITKLGLIRKYTEAEIKEARARYRPKRITVLLVGESPPSNGTFFYCCENNLLRHIRSAIGGPSQDGDFLESFKARGWYLDDLVSTPIDKLPPKERERKWWDAQHDLAIRIAEYQPKAIVSLLLGIEPVVDAAAKEANSNADRHAVPFPGRWTMGRFLEKMRDIVPKLPKIDMGALP